MKLSSLLCSSGLIVLALGLFAVRADEVVVTTEATIIGASSATNVNEAALGYVHVQYSSGPTLARKAYFQFDLTGLNPDTNALATFTIVPRNSYKHRVQLWGLDQPYPTFNADITWATAQANDTSNNDLLTAGPYTGSKIGADVLIPLSGTDPYTFTIPRLGDYLFDQKITLVLTALADANNNSSGLRLRTNAATLTFSQWTGNLPPVISTIADQTLAMRQSSAPLPFTVSDDSTPPDSLALWATSANENVIPSGFLSLSGASANRALTLTAANQPGTAVVTIHAQDGAGLEAVKSFLVTVTADPVITPLPHTNLLANATTAPLPFTVGSWDIPVASLVVTASSGNPTLVPESGVVISGSGSNRTVTVTPAANQTGVAPITLTVSDGVNPASTTSFSVMVLPADAKVVFVDRFDYADGEIIPLSADFWSRRNSGTTKLLISAQEALIRSSGSSFESALAPLAGGPYFAGNRRIFYTSVRATWTTLPRNSTGPFFHLGDRVALDSEYFVRVHTVTNGLPEGFFRLGVAAGPGSSYRDLTQDLTTNVTYTLVTRYDMDAGVGTLWVNPTSELDPSVSATDVPGSQVGSVGLRQAAGMGTIQLNDLTVRVLTGPTLSRVLPPSGGTLQLDFTAGAEDAVNDFTVVGASELTAPFSELTATIVSLGGGKFQATIPVTGSQGFYRIQRQPLTFN